MTDNLANDAHFWDEFATEYEEIQQESKVATEQTLTDFLLAKGILPNQKLLDLAGGSGRYLPYLQPLVKSYTFVDFSKEMLAIAKRKSQRENVAFLNLEQQQFFKQTADHVFDVVFTAMNPALKPADIAELLRISRQWVLIFRLVKQTDSLFSPFEPIEAPDAKLGEYQRWLADQHLAYQIKHFVFQPTEVIERSFFQDYFATDYSKAELEKITQQVFGPALTAINMQKIEFDLLYLKTEPSD